MGDAYVEIATSHAGSIVKRWTWFLFLEHDFVPQHTQRELWHSLGISNRNENEDFRRTMLSSELLSPLSGIYIRPYACACVCVWRCGGILHNLYIHILSTIYEQRSAHCGLFACDCFGYSVCWHNIHETILTYRIYRVHRVNWWSEVYEKLVF